MTLVTTIVIHGESMSITISKSKLKANMLQIFRELEASGGELIVTDRDKPVLRIVPIQEKRSVDEAFAQFRSGVSYDKDALDEPTMDEWEEV